MQKRKEAEQKLTQENRAQQNTISTMSQMISSLEEKGKDLEKEIEQNVQAQEASQNESEGLIKNIQDMNKKNIEKIENDFAQSLADIEEANENNIAHYEKKVISLIKQNEELEKGLCLYIPHKFDHIDLALA